MRCVSSHEEISCLLSYRYATGLVPLVRSVRPWPYRFSRKKMLCCQCALNVFAHVQTKLTIQMVITSLFISILQLKQPVMRRCKLWGIASDPVCWNNFSLGLYHPLNLLAVLIASHVDTHCHSSTLHLRSLLRFIVTVLDQVASVCKSG